jgi:hypothetical protein
MTNTIQQPLPVEVFLLRARETLGFTPDEDLAPYDDSLVCRYGKQLQSRYQRKLSNAKRRWEMEAQQAKEEAAFMVEMAELGVKVYPRSHFKENFPRVYKDFTSIRELQKFILASRLLQIRFSKAMSINQKFEAVYGLYCDLKTSPFAHYFLKMLPNQIIHNEKCHGEDPECWTNIMQICRIAFPKATKNDLDDYEFVMEYCEHYGATKDTFIATLVKGMEDGAADYYASRQQARSHLPIREQIRKLTNAEKKEINADTVWLYLDEVVSTPLVSLRLSDEELYYLGLAVQGYTIFVCKEADCANVLDVIHRFDGEDRWDVMELIAKKVDGNPDAWRMAMKNEAATSISPATFAGHAKQRTSTDTTCASLETTPCCAAGLGVVTGCGCTPIIERVKVQSCGVGSHTSFDPLVTGHVGRYRVKRVTGAVGVSIVVCFCVGVHHSSPTIIATNCKARTKNKMLNSALTPA